MVIFKNLIIPFTFVNCKKELIIKTDYRVLFYSTGYNPLLSVFILMLKIVIGLASKSPFKLVLVPFDMLYSHF